jgi:hypothetical protein
MKYTIDEQTEVIGAVCMIRFIYKELRAEYEDEKIEWAINILNNVLDYNVDE